MPHLTPGQHIHLVGIGGAGLSAIARILLGQGYRVSGSDRTLNPLTEALEREGAAIYAGHDAAHIAGADALIVSSAIRPDQAEVAAALAAGVPVYKRADIMADLLRGKQVIAVAGTAGKTTTTAMITHILLETGRQPSYIIGGVLTTSGVNAEVGAGECFVIEADEYDNMFLGLRPNIAVVTNVEWDHPDFFETPEDTQRAFEQFVNLLPDDGTLVVCTDDPGGRKLWLFALRQNRFWAIPYGIKVGEIAAVVHSDDSFEFSISDQPWTARLLVPGLHNVRNALAAIIAAGRAGVPTGEAIAALATFRGTARRFELRGEVDGIAVIDDYAHHPTKIRATLQAARSRYPNREIWAVWQPHTYSRTQALRENYLTAFADADHVLITDIYAAREMPIPGVSAAEIAGEISNARYTATFAEAVEVLLAEVKPPAAVIVMSAGDATQIGGEYLRRKGNR
jgi:UDP-N-acetylmuramate--alanine ligase